MYIAHIFSLQASFAGLHRKAHVRGRIGNNNEVEIPLVYIAHGTANNVLPIASTSRIFESSLRKNGYKVESREFSEGHHLADQVVDQAMTWLNNGVSTTSLKRCLELTQYSIRIAFREN